jgi:hypothetical protein
VPGDGYPAGKRRQDRRIQGLDENAPDRLRHAGRLLGARDLDRPAVHEQVAAAPEASHLTTSTLARMRRPVGTGARLAGAPAPVLPEVG